MTPFVPEMGRLPLQGVPLLQPLYCRGCSRARTDLKMPMGFLIIEPSFLTCARTADKTLLLVVPRLHGIRIADAQHTLVNREGLLHSGASSYPVLLKHAEFAPLLSVLWCFASEMMQDSGKGVNGLKTASKSFFA